MKLGFDKLKVITLGAVRVEETDGAVAFFRFTEEQQRFYATNKDGLYKKTFATAGVKMRFKTDGTALRLKYRARQASSRLFFAADVFADGAFRGGFGNCSGIKSDANYIKQSFPFGDFYGEVFLGEGEKEVSVYFPWSAVMEITEAELVGATFVSAVKPTKKMLVFGDSITQGYDAIRPSKRYAARLADALGAEEINKAIGAEIFVPELAALADDFKPDYISVAYGTNDWSKTEFSDFKERCEKFFFNLYKNYKGSKIFALAPLWRKDYAVPRMGWEFEKVAETIKAAAEKYESTEFIDCFGFIPPDENNFSDRYLHPNDKGFDFYAENLASKIVK
ncbi:MAG: SGNH/GDSL hydrolase family protein [Clostridia bacterium]|nr:SGNH/GDSL hydrolase family protein [Clostridia bacterium]